MVKRKKSIFFHCCLSHLNDPFSLCMIRRAALFTSIIHHFFLPPFSQHAISLSCPSKQAKHHSDFTEEQAELTPVSSVRISWGCLNQRRKLDSLEFQMMTSDHIITSTFHLKNLII